MRLDLLGVAYLASLVDLLPSQAEVGHGGFNVPLGNLEIAPASMAGNLPPILRGVVLVSEATLRLPFRAISGPLAGVCF